MGGLIIIVLKDMKVCVPLIILGKMSAERMNEDSVNYLSLTIRMRLERRGKFKVTINECPEGALECAQKTGFPIRYYAFAKHKMWPDMFKKQFGGL